MKQRRTQQNGTKRPTKRARTTETVPDTVPGTRSTVKKRSTKTGPNQEETRTTVGAVPVAEAAQIFGVDPKTVKRMCTSGKLDCFKTPGGHWRVYVASIEALRRGNSDAKLGRSSVSSPSLQYRKESLEEVRLLIEEKKARGALQELEDQERQRREQEEAARRAEENDARRLQRERDTEQARRDREREEERRKQEEFERWQYWIDEQVQFGLNLVPPDVSGRFALQIQTAVEEALQGLGPSRARAIVERAVHSAVQQAVQPWLREQAITQAADEAVKRVRDLGYWGNREVENRAREEAFKAIAALTENATSDQMQAVARSIGQQMVQLHREEQDQQKRLEEQERAQRSREEQANTYLWNVLPYLQELQAASDGIDFQGELFMYEQRIKNAIRPRLIEEAATLDYVSGPKRVRELAKQWLDESPESQ